MTIIDNALNGEAFVLPANLDKDETVIYFGSYSIFIFYVSTLFYFFSCS